MTLRVLQLSRSMIDGGFDYQREITRAFDGKGVDVTTVFQRGVLTAERQREYNGRVVCLDARRRRVYKNPWVAALRLLALGRRAAFDVAICHHYTPALIVNRLQRLWNIPRMFFIVHDFDYFDAKDEQGARRNRFVTRSLDPRCRLVAVSHAIRRNVLNSMPGLDPDRCIVIHNAIDMARLERERLGRAEARRQLGLDPDAFIFGTVGRLVSFKAHGELIDTFAKAQAEMPAAQLVIVGRGPLKQELAARISGYGLQDRVRLTDFVPDASRLMSAFDCFVLPSHNVPFGLVLLEAMACRLPVIANNTGAVPEVLPYREGIVDVTDTGGFAAKLLEFYRCPEARRRQLGDLGYDHAEREFSLDQYRARYRALGFGDLPDEPSSMPGDLEKA